ncbi:hypothetical protein [Tenacibaculum singaporense]|nr:hypothetical protein [Tenacibaculum singaporense]
MVKKVICVWIETFEAEFAKDAGFEYYDEDYVKVGGLTNLN